MMYPFMTLDNDTEIVHSELMKDGKVKVYIEPKDSQMTTYILGSNIELSDLDTNELN